MKRVLFVLITLVGAILLTGFMLLKACSNSVNVTTKKLPIAYVNELYQADIETFGTTPVYEKTVYEKTVSLSVSSADIAIKH